MSCFMGIDAGTSGVKVVIITEEGVIKGMGYHECNLITPQPGWTEQNPEDWWKACDYAVKQAVQNSGCGSEVKAIGFSGQMQGVTMMDADMKPLRNCIIWLDQRADAEVREIEQVIDPRAGLDITANYCLNSFWAPKLLWAKKHEPENFDKTKTVLFAKDYIRYRMTGEAATEVSDASLSYLMDVPKRKWAWDMFDKLGIPREMAPERLLESQDVAGHLRDDIAKEWGLTGGIPVVAGGGDQPAGCVGTGVVKDGVIGATIGTSGVVVGSTDRPFVDEKKRAVMSMAHSVPDKWCYLGLVLSAGGSFKWLRDTVFADKKAEMAAQGKDVYDYMTELATQSTPGSEGLAFLPYLNGEKTPVDDANARGVFFGLSYRHGLPEICRSVMEGVTFALCDMVEICRELGFAVKEVRANGGGAKSALWRQMQADIYNADVITMNMEEGPAAGGAIMAAVGAGAFGGVEEACDALLEVESVTHPIENNVKQYRDFYATYKALYPALKDLYAAQVGNVSKHMK